jgi:hypothetical protein
MIYMVEMALSEMDRRVEWEAWYLAHQKMLLTIPGFNASQRFETIHPTPAPFVALHDVDGPEVFTSPAYTSKAGPAGTGEWRTKMTNWSRNLFTGLDHTPDVGLDQWLLVIEENSPAARNPALTLHWMKAVGLDVNVPRRALTIVGSAEVARGFVGTQGIRVCRPLMRRITE